MWEGTGKCTVRTTGVWVQLRGERFAEITPGRSDSQLGLAATREDRSTEGDRSGAEGFGPAHERVGAKKMA